MTQISKILKPAAIGVAAIALSLAAGAQATKKPACINGRVLSAMQMRIAQTELMVAGLSCRQFEQWAASSNTKRYNEFVTRYRPVLMNDTHRVLAKYFPTEQRLNDYLTRLANEAQQRGLANMAIFCTQASKIYDDTLNAEPVQLPIYSASLPMAAQHGHELCAGVVPLAQPAQPIEASAPAAPAAAVAPQASSAAPASSAPQSSSATTPPATTVLASNDVPAAGAPARAMTPISDAPMRAAVKSPPRPQIKPAF